MIVDEGKLKLHIQQQSYLGSLDWLLFVTNVTITAATVYADVSGVNEAGWSGYARQNANSWSSPVIVSNKSFMQDLVLPVFVNTSGSTQTFYGWALVDSGSGVLIAAVNLGATVIPVGGNYVLNPGITLDQA